MGRICFELLMGAFLVNGFLSAIDCGCVYLLTMAMKNTSTVSQVVKFLNTRLNAAFLTGVVEKNKK